jgi:hypothetical protein
MFLTIIKELSGYTMSRKENLENHNPSSPRPRKYWNDAKANATQISYCSCLKATAIGKYNETSNAVIFS